MRDRAPKVLALSIFLTTVVRLPFAGGQEGLPEVPKKVLVELYTSQGCDSCPPASDLLGKLAGLGYGSDRVVPINFHVDYFNQPWADPYSDASYSRRQLQYNEVLRRDDLYFTPLMMVDGRHPLLGSDRAKVERAMREALKERPGVAIEAKLEGAEARKTLSVKITARTPEMAGRDLLIGVALTEDPVTTKVLRGENAGQTLVEHHVIRGFKQKMIRLDRMKPRTLLFPEEIPAGGEPARFRLTVFAQDRANGKIYQVDAVSWTQPQSRGPSAGRTRNLKGTIARRNARHATSAQNMNATALDFLSALMGMDAFGYDASANSSSEAATICPACGSPFSPPPAVRSSPRPGQAVSIVMTC